jgi:toxin ParE1/3/4
MRVELTVEAEQDLRNIALHIAESGVETAARFVGKLRDACAGLSSFPNRFALVPRYEHLGVRHRVVGHFLIFYRVEKNRVIVLHIRHGAMDYADLLKMER